MIDGDRDGLKAKPARSRLRRLLDERPSRGRGLAVRSPRFSGRDLSRSRLSKASLIWHLSAVVA